MITQATYIFKQRKVFCEGQVATENRSSAAASEHLKDQIPGETWMTWGDSNKLGLRCLLNTVDFAVDSAMINSGAAGLPLSCLYHLTISSCWLTTPSEASKNGNDCKCSGPAQARHAYWPEGSKASYLRGAQNRFRMC